MKKIFIFILLSCMLLSSCNNINKQYFIEGEFISENNDASFKVTKISKEEYVSANNVNVVCDKNNPNGIAYYRLEFKIFNIENVIEMRNFEITPRKNSLTYYTFDSNCDVSLLYVRYDEKRKDNMPYMIYYNYTNYVFK